MLFSSNTRKGFSKSDDQEDWDHLDLALEYFYPIYGHDLFNFARRLCGGPVWMQETLPGLVVNQRKQYQKQSVGRWVVLAASTHNSPQRLIFNSTNTPKN